MSWLRFFKKILPDEPARLVPANPRQTPAKPKDEPAADYSANPYDTYTWELQTDADGERQLKRAHLVDQRPKQDGESFNPYDTGKFGGGW